MKKIFCYVFYRASKFYKSWGESNNYYISGKFLLFLALCANVLTLIGLFCLLLKIKYRIEVVYATWFVFCILSFFILNEKKYEELAAHLQSSVFKLSKDLIDSIHEEGIVAYTS